MVLRVVEDYKPRAVVMCFGPDAAPYRVELYSGYHAERPEVPDELVWQFAHVARVLRGVRLGRRPRRLGRGRRPARLLRAARDRRRRPHAGPDRRPRHVPVRVRRRARALREDRHRRRGGHARGGRAPLRRAARAGAGLHRAARRPVATGCRGRRGSARRRPRRSCSAAGRSRTRSRRPQTSRRRASQGRCVEQADELLRVQGDRDAAASSSVERPEDAAARPRGRGGRGAQARDEPAGGAVGGGWVVVSDWNDMHDDHYDNVLEMSPEERYAYFITTVTAVRRGLLPRAGRRHADAGGLGDRPRSVHGLAARPPGGGLRRPRLRGHGAARRCRSRTSWDFCDQLGRTTARWSR